MHTQALEAADKLLLTREAIVGVADRHGLDASFVPKLCGDAAGCGCHCHFSLWKVREGLWYELLACGSCVKRERNGRRKAAWDEQKMRKRGCR